MNMLQRQWKTEMTLTMSEYEQIYESILKKTSKRMIRQAKNDHEEDLEKVQKSIGKYKDLKEPVEKILKSAFAKPFGHFGPEATKELAAAMQKRSKKTGQSIEALVEKANSILLWILEQNSELMSRSAKLELQKKDPLEISLDTYDHSKNLIDL